MALNVALLVLGCLPLSFRRRLAAANFRRWAVIRSFNMLEFELDASAKGSGGEEKGLRTSRAQHTDTLSRTPSVRLLFLS